MKVSVVVPIHNSKRYMSECIESILQQTLESIEIICVDSSTDGTTEMLYQYKVKDNRIQIIEDTNSSYGYKLNTGIRYAKGDYIAIVESDDYIEDCMLEKLYAAATEFGVDFVKSNYEGFIDVGNNRWFCPYERVDEQDYNRVICLNKERRQMLSVGYNIWTGLYQTEFLRRSRIQFHESEGASYQDIGFAVQITMMAKKTYFLKDYFYKYRMDNISSSVKSNEKYKCIPKEFVWLKEQIDKLGCNDEVNNTFFGIMRMKSYYWNYRRLSEEYREKLLAYCFKDDIGMFDESLLDYRMPEKEHIYKLYKDDNDSKRWEREFEKKKQKVYRDIMDISHEHTKIIIVCCGLYGQAVYRFFKMIGRVKEIIICDNNIQEELTYFGGNKIISVNEAVRQNQDGYFIIANKTHNQELQCQIEELGISKEKIYICDYMPSGVGLLSDFRKYCIDTAVYKF